MVLARKRSSLYVIVFAICLMILAGSIMSIGLILPNIPQVRYTDADQYVNVLGSKVRYQYYSRSGSEQKTVKEPVLILLHGFGNFKEQWEKVAPHLDYESVISLDMIGFGGSDKPSIPYTIETQRQYLLAFMDKLNIDKAVLAGISMGASVSAWTAANSPNRIQGIILFAPSAYPGSLAKKWPYNWLYQPGFINSTASNIIDTSLYKHLFPNSMGAQAITVTSSYDQQFASALDKISQPTFLVWSKGDKTTPYKFSSEYRSRIRDLKFIEVPENLGHNILRRSPEKSTEIINQFLSNIHI